MDHNIECPVCEFQFSIPKVSSEILIDCPSCSRSFPYSRAVEIPVSRSTSETRPPTASRLAVPPAFESPSSPVDRSIPIAQPTREALPVAKKPILALQRKRRDRRRLVTTILTLAILAASIGILGGLLVQRLKENPIVSDGFPGTVLDSSESSRNSESGAQADSPDDLDEPEDGAPVVESAEVERPISSADLPSQTFAFRGNQKKSKGVWDAVRPQLVGLKVHDGLGAHDAVGTIVDSRGWVLTSYQAVKGASRIEVTASVQTIDDVWKTEPLTDLARGYVAASQNDDLILLSINRRFVVAFSMVQPIARNNVVQGEYLFQCAPPSRQNVYGITESKITQRSELNGLDPTAQSIIRQKQLAEDPIVWLVASNETAPTPGTPLFRTDGELAAINVFVNKKQNYFVPVEGLKALIENAEDEVKPLSKLGGSAATRGPIAVAPNHSMYPLSIRLNQLAETCRAFKWIPETAQQYESFQQFSEAYREIRKFADENTESTVVEDQKIVAQETQLRNELVQRASSLSAEDAPRIASMNKEFAGRELSEADRAVPFYGEVHYVDIVNAQVILKLTGTDIYAKAPFIPSDDPMRLQTRWLFFARTPAESRRMNFRISESELVTAESIADLQNFGEQ